MDNLATEPLDGTEQLQQQEPEVELLDDETLTGESESEAGEKAEEYEEVEYQGAKYQVPKELKNALMMQSDYSKKTAEVAERNKALETKEQTLAKEAEVRQQLFTDYAEVYAIDRQLEQYNKLNWTALFEEDTMEYLKLDKQFQVLKEAKLSKLSTIQRTEAERNQKQQQEFAKLKEESRSKLPKEIKNWSLELEKSLRDYGKQSGFGEENISQAFDYYPQHVKTLYKAYMYDQMLKKASERQKVQTEVVPAPKVSSGKSPAPTQYSSKMSDAEFAKWRRKSTKK